VHHTIEVIADLHVNLSWIVFSYRASSETSTLRVRAWRILKRIGALSIQHSACVVPRTPLTVTKLKKLQALIEEAAGEVMWLEVSAFSPDSVSLLVERFNQERSEDYKAFIQECSKFSSTISVVECEAEIKRLQKSFRKIHARDYFECPEATVAAEELSEVQIRFTEWLSTVTKK